MGIKKSESCTEKRILEAAKTVFIRKGFDGTSMEDIAAEAKITRPSLNYYFRTKEKLFSAIFKDVIGSFLPRVESVALGKKPVFKRIEEVVEIYTEMLFKNPGILTFVANESHRNPGRYFEILHSMPEFPEMGKRIGDEIKRNMSEGKLREMPLEYFATTFFGLLFFPFLAKNIVTGIFFGGSDARFDKFISDRRQFVVESMKSIFKPKRK